MHNLMIINYCEIVDHNDRVNDNQGELQQYMQSPQMEEDMLKDQETQADKRKYDEKMKRELDLQERI